MSQFMKKMFYKQRADFEKDAIQRDQNYSLPEDVIEHKNIYYSNDKQKEHHLDIYYPASKSTSPLPVIINVHGGGLLLGNKEFNRPFCAKLCQAGYLVFSIEYRLIPDCLFYDQCQDLSNAFDFIESLLPQYNGDSSRIYAAGDSGGACLLLYACAMQNDPKLAKAAGIKPSSIPLQALGFIQIKKIRSDFFSHDICMERIIRRQHLLHISVRKTRKFFPHFRHLCLLQAKMTICSIIPYNLKKHWRKIIHHTN